MKLRGHSSSGNTIAIALLAATVSLSALSGSGCTDSSGGGAGGAGGAAMGGQGGAAGGFQGLAGDTAAGGQGGDAAGSPGGSTAPCAATVAATSGIDPTTRLDALTLAQKAAYCDWAASRYCGYGHLVDCGDGNYLGVTSQADCIANMENTVCATPVSVNEACEVQTSCGDLFPEPCLTASTCQ